jgi:hypothetical protein
MVHTFAPVLIGIFFGIMACYPSACHLSQLLRVLSGLLKINVVPLLTILEACALAARHAMESSKDEFMSVKWNECPHLK